MEKDEIETIDGYWHIPQNHRKITWAQYEQVLKKMCLKIENHIKFTKQTIDAIVPILRGGLVPANFLAYRLKLLKIIPIQYKYLQNEEGDFLKQLFPFNPNGLEKKSTILLVDNNHGKGLQAEIAASEIKALLPDATIIYTTTFMDISYQTNKYADTIIYGELSNATITLSPRECKEAGVEFKAPFFPWENIEEEAYIDKNTNFKYVNEDKIISGSKTVKNFSDSNEQIPSH